MPLEGGVWPVASVGSVSGRTRWGRSTRELSRRSAPFSRESWHGQDEIDVRARPYMATKKTTKVVPAEKRPEAQGQGPQVTLPAEAKLLLGEWRATAERVRLGKSARE